MPKKKALGRTRIAVGMIDEQDGFTVAKNLASMCRLAKQAGRLGCDLFASEEGGLSLFCGAAGWLKVPGPETRKIAAIARQYKMYIALGLKMKAGKGRAWNAQVMIDRSGKIMGVYKKILPTNGEILAGIVPGDEMNVFDCDFGRVACMICYDTQFPEIPRMAGVRNIDLALFSHVGGAIMGDFIGRTIAFENTCWCATVGRGCNAFADPRGRTKAHNKTIGKLLCIDADLQRITPAISASMTAWRVNQLMERRPEICELLLGPPIDVECPALPLYLGNAMAPGRNTLEFALVNRSSKRQRGAVEAIFPFPMCIHSDEHVAWYVRKEVGQEDWQPTPKRLRFDLRPGQRKECRVRYTIPDNAEGIEAIRLIGKTDDGQEILWQRQLTRFLEPPTLHVPRVARIAEVATQGVRLRLDQQFMGGPAKSKTTVRLAHTGESLLIHAVCRKYGPWMGQDDVNPPGAGDWHDKAAQSPDAISIPIIPESWIDRVFWLTLARTGQASTQRREGNTPVEGHRPEWAAKIDRDDKQWTALLELPFSEFEEEGGPAEDAERRWRINFQRSAVLPAKANRERYMSEVVYPPPEQPGPRLTLGVEAAVWNPPYARIDCVDRLGTIVFD